MKSYLSLVIHNHQPVGNFDSVFEQAWQKSYKPFLDVLLDHPQIKLSLHTSGCLFEWLEMHQRSYFDLIGKLISRDQIELIGGAFYEPILTVIPKEDALEQFRRMSEYLKRRFGVTPRGAWVPERVWEPQLAEILSESGIEYVPLDDDQFLAAGHQLKDLNSYFISESDAKPIALFPIHKQLRYTIPFEYPAATFDYILSHADGRENSLYVMGDDGEKFGLWPRTHKPVYEDRWLHSFFETLEQESDTIETLTLSEARERIKPFGRTYLPAGSYLEMSEWVLPSDSGREFDKWVSELKHHGVWNDVRPFFRGGFWRGFLSKYPEANYLHKKMLRTSRKFHEISKRKTESEFQTPVLRGQCNCAYWHGVFGGLYLPHLRHAVWKELIRGEYEMDNITHRGRRWIEIESVDHDTDGHRELLLENAAMNCYVSPERGGSIFEWDYRPRGYNLMNTLTRRPERYHDRLSIAHVANGDEGESASIHNLVLAKEPDLLDKLFYDHSPRAALLDRFYGQDATVEHFRQGKLEDLGTFLNQPYEVQEIFTDGFAMHRRGRVGDVDISVKKTVKTHPGKAVLDIDYEICNHSDRDFGGPFGVEWNLALMAGKSNKHHISIPEIKEWNRPLGETEVYLDIHECRLADEHEGVAVRFSFDAATTLWRAPVESISLSEGGFERVFQSIAMLFSWTLYLRPGDVWTRRITARLSNA